MSRVFPANIERWAVKLSIGNRISQLSNKSHSRRKLSVQAPLTKKQSSQKRKDGIMNFIVESKRQIGLDARDTIKRIEQWHRQSCAMLDMAQQHILQDLRDDHPEPTTVNNTKKTSKKAALNRSSAKKSSIDVKKSTANAKKASETAKKSKKIAQKQSTTAKTAPAAASKAPKEKPPSATNGTAKKSSSSSAKQNVANSSKKSAHRSADQHLNCLPDLSSDSSSDDEPTENVPVAKTATCPSMPVLQAEENESDDSWKSFMKKPIESAKAVLKRRQSDFAFAPISDYPMRKKTMPVHSSVLAIANRSPSIIFEPQSDGEPEMAKRACSTPVRAVDKTNNVRKIAEKEPEPIPNILKSKSSADDEVYTNFEKLRERMNQAKKNAGKANTLNDNSGDASGPASLIQEERIDNDE